MGKQAAGGTAGIVVGLGFGGCAAPRGPHAEAAATAEQEKIDPWEGGNRKVFGFNEAVDIHAIEPVARGWNKIMPNQVQESLTNFYSNLRYPVVFFNDLFQAKPADAALETGRFLVNTTLGFGDVRPATLAGEIVVSSEVILGYTTLGLLLSVLAQSIARRS